MAETPATLRNAVSILLCCTFIAECALEMTLLGILFPWLVQLFYVPCIYYPLRCWHSRETRGVFVDDVVITYVLQGLRCWEHLYVTSCLLHWLGLTICLVLASNILYNITVSVPTDFLPVWSAYPGIGRNQVFCHHMLCFIILEMNSLP